MTKIDFSMMVTAESRAVAALSVARSEAAARLAALIEAATAALSEGIPLAEQLTWSAKETAAEAVLAGTASPIQEALLEAEAGQSGETVMQLASSILSHAEAYRAEVTRYVGLRRQASASLAACSTPEELAQVLEMLEARL
ncbi:hypothetical protein [Pseudotabrizicola sp. 4114]|uniref:hypothetical protein n=1 Tax=Pseudotabrizicola sp. 4114 TaxID=2817731 RepID=UPI0028596DFC|nr:hypothetical protein [Pseudorhodobacter sp. 4114]